MNNLESLTGEDPEDLLVLLENIVACYQDNDSRPAEALTLYRQRMQLATSYRAKIAKRFVAIDDGNNQPPLQQGFGHESPSVKPHAKPAAKGPSLTLLP
jgi:hypothetical protein